jgi:RecB family exonuclease
MGDARLIEWVSPSAVARLQSCAFAESIRRSPAHGPAPSNPAGRLGNAAHRVLEWIAEDPSPLCGTDAEERIGDRWILEVTAEYKASLDNELEPSYGPLETWPGYHRITAAIRVDGASLAWELNGIPRDRRLTEEELATSDSRIRGTADLIVIGDDGTATIIDHKSGAVHAEDVAVGGRYEQQAMLYAAMALDAGMEPRTCELRPLGRAPISIGVSEARVASAREEAKAQMARYNAAIASGNEFSLADPSESSCGWCPYALSCDALWIGESRDLGEFGMVAGTIGTVQLLPASLALKLESEAGELTVTGLPQTDVKGQLPAKGQTVRIVGLHFTSAVQAKTHPGRARMLISQPA